MRVLIRHSARQLGLALSFILAALARIHGQPATPAITSDPGQTNADDLATYKKMSLEELMDQEVTSVARQPQAYGQAPAAIQVVTGDQIARSGASSIPEALRLADNLDVAQVNAHDWSISARGFNSNLADKLLVLMDGRAVYSPLQAGVLWDMQDYLLEDIDRMEVISGPGGALWGANAVNGVINITTKSAADTQGLYLEAGGGTELQDFTGMRYGGTLSSNVFFRVYGKFYNRDDELLANGSNAPDGAIQGQGGFRLDTAPDAPNVFTLEGDLYDGNDDLAAGNERVGGGHLLGRWSRTFSDTAAMSLQAYYDRTHLAYPYGTLGTLFDNLDTADLEFQNNFGLGERQKVVWGLGYRFTHETDQSSAGDDSDRVIFLPATLDQDLFTGFLQDEIRLCGPLYLTLGSKLEHNDYTGFEYEPDIRLQWNVTPKQMLWAAVSRAVRTPSRLDEDLDIATTYPPPFQTFVSGNPDFESETVIAYELGYRAELGRKVSTSVSLFYNVYDKLRSLATNTVPGHYGLPEMYENNLNADTYGIEFSSDYQMFDWWRLHAGYDFLNEHVYPDSDDQNHGLDETADPQNQVFLRSSMDLPCRTELNTAFRWIDRVQNDNNGAGGTVPSYAEMDVRFGWKATKNLEISLVGQNLLHDHHAEAGFPGPAQEQIARGFYGKIEWRF